MLRNYFKIALRNLTANKTFSVINILGLALGMAAVLLIALYARHEFSYDKFIEDRDNIYRVYRSWDPESNTVWTPSLLAQKLMAEFPEVEAASGMSAGSETLMEYRGDKQYVEDVVSVDSTFFRTLPLPFEAGAAAFGTYESYRIFSHWPKTVNTVSLRMRTRSLRQAGLEKKRQAGLIITLHLSR